MYWSIILVVEQKESGLTQKKQIESLCNAISQDGHYFGIIRQPKKFASQNVDQKNYSALAVGDCKI